MSGAKSTNEKQPLLSDASVNALKRAASASPIGTTKRRRDGDLRVGEVVRSILSTAWKIAIAMGSWVAMKATDSALLGHVSSAAIEAASLSDLYTSASGVFIQGNVLNVLAGQALGARNEKLIGVWFQVSLAVVAAIAVVVVVLWGVTEPVLVGLGVDPSLARLAGHYSLILALAIPTRIINSQLNQTLQSQKIMLPPVVASIVAMVFNVLVGIPLVLGTVPFGGDKPGLGFLACPSVTVFAEALQAFVLFYVFVYRRKLYESWWPGWSLSHITKRRMIAFLKLYVPAALSLASDFWRVSVIGTLAATFGEAQVAVFNSSYRILWIVLTGVVAFASSMSIQLNIAFGAGLPRNAKFVVTVGIFMILLILTVGGMVVFIATSYGGTGRLFSDDPEILKLFEETALPMTIVTTCMPLSVALERIPLAMGRSRVVLVMGLIGSWALQVPLAYLFTHYLTFRTPIFRLFLGVGVGYAGVCLLLMIYIFTTDFAAAARDAQVTAEKKQQSASLTINESPDDADEEETQA
jgi:MATE family multidrug resistance protein